MTNQDTQILRFSLIFVWLFTALVSLWERNGRSSQLLADVGVHDASVVAIVIVCGAALDTALGLAMWFKPARFTYLAALAAMLLMTGVATLLAPSLWLEPLGPLTKNIPIAAALYMLARGHP